MRNVENGPLKIFAFNPRSTSTEVGASMFGIRAINDRRSRIIIPVCELAYEKCLYEPDAADFSSPVVVVIPKVRTVNTI